MKVVDLHPWPATAEEATAIQDTLRPLADLTSPGPPTLRTVAGLDVAYADDRLAAAVVVLDADSLDVVEEATVLDRPAFPYIPGLFAFRELPALVGALRELTVTPDLLVCDGHGLAHPKRFGLACHLGVLTGLPAIGVGKTRLVGSYDEPATDRGAWSALSDGGQVVGRALRTQTGVRPVFVSVGHRADLEAACALTLRLAPRYRLPETTRLADRLSRRTLTGC
ncbi:endonuclease V [Actinoallomurus bryophytorum]|uniref:Endonuclease V n=1 Tax=Actinoallomurus bryophytorum TaxID=1490222 RepID=A0A543CDW5_9ACTN|nr:endonuclease V [Actinoallomurus bryophytorum]TQL95127.1 endonuclease V [Actinoallomurus bryophytorum]